MAKWGIPSWDFGLYDNKDVKSLLEDILKAPMKSVDKDNMEFDVRLSIYQLDNIRKILGEK
jgi:hypothetical protein